MTAPRIVLDTNVLVSALLFHKGTLTWLRRAWQTERIKPLASKDTIAELIRVLAYPKFRLADEDRQHLLADYLPWCESVSVPSASTVNLPVCRDPADIPFLVLAITAEADALVTGDRDLLELAGHYEISILTPAAFARDMGEV